MVDRTETKINYLREHRTRVEAIGLEHLKSYVENRTKVVGIFASLAPQSKHVIDAQKLLLKAQADLESYAASMGGAVQEPEDATVDVEQAPVRAHSLPEHRNFYGDTFVYAAG